MPLLRGTTEQANGFFISSESLKRSERSTGATWVGNHLNSWSIWANHKWTVAKPNALPGQTLRPDPNGASLRSEPMIDTSSSMNLVGLKAHGSSHMVGSWVMAHMLTIAVVPAGILTLSTWTSWIAKRAHESRGPGGWSRSTSLTMAWRKGRCWRSESWTRLGLVPMHKSSSSWAFAWISWCRTILAMIHSRSVATVSAPLKTVSCKSYYLINYWQFDIH